MKQDISRNDQHRLKGLLGIEYTDGMPKLCLPLIHSMAALKTVCNFQKDRILFRKQADVVTFIIASTYQLFRSGSVTLNDRKQNGNIQLRRFIITIIYPNTENLVLWARSEKIG